MDEPQSRQRRVFSAKFICRNDPSNAVLIETFHLCAGARDTTSLRRHALSGQQLSRDRIRNRTGAAHAVLSDIDANATPRLAGAHGSQRASRTLALLACARLHSLPKIFLHHLTRSAGLLSTFLQFDAVMEFEFCLTTSSKR